MIEARVICDSVGEHSPRLTTFLTRYPKFIHAEHMRHRTGSYSVSSSRAIPVAKNLEEVRSDELRAAPVWWGREQRGMQSGEELSDEPISENDWYGPLPDERPLPSERQLAKDQWGQAALMAASVAHTLVLRRVHKSIVNRLLEPFLHVNVLWTTAEPGLLNFLGLRLDKVAQPEMRALAEAVWRAWNESEPQRLEPGQWHLPFVKNEHDLGLSIPFDLRDRGWSESLIETARLVSMARCARLSYMSFETQRRSVIQEDLILADKLITSRHWSPAEHQATPDTKISWWIDDERNPRKEPDFEQWEHPEQGGNLGPGWRQYRKILPGEAVAPLPEGYVR